MALDAQMEKYLLESHEEAKEIVRELCRLPAPSHHEEKRASWCEAWFRKACKNTAANIYIDDALNAVCEYNVTKDNDLVVFMAHMDTVFPDTEPMPFVEKDGRFFSPGVTDDTGNLASLLIAERYILANNIPAACGMVFVANSCEEGLGNLKGSREIVSRYGKRIKEFITVDGTSLERIVNGAVGSHRYEITVKTEGGHSYGAFGNRNAIACLASMINTLYSVKVPQDGDLKTTYNVGIISGGTSVNTIAQEAMMLYEYRSTSRKCLCEMENMLYKVIDAYRATGIGVEIERIGDRPCTGDVDKDAHEALIEKARTSIRRVLGRDERLAYSSTDANTPLSQGIPAICLGGAVGGKCHTREEWLDPESLLDGSRLLLDFMTNYLVL
ncbi:MAG: M20/M25/M40 family metallo-hydrolase [Spirochaetales bacterium]|nr:M20/M25/M40 family metallo-hydrolase [Spirochaetales bacterium]